MAIKDVLNNVSIDGDVTENKVKDDFKVEKIFNCNFDTNDEKLGVPQIKLFGIGGAGNNIISHIWKSRGWPININSWLLNTDKKTLVRIKNQNIESSYFLIGEKKLHGYGSGGDPDIGKMAFEENANEIRNILKDTDILFLFAGLGKGTGSGVTPEIAKIAKSMGILTIAVVTLPSIDVEGRKTYENANESYKILSENVDSMCTISNDKIIRTGSSFFEQFELANKEISQIFSDFTDIVTNAGEINIDFHDFENFLKKNKYFFHAIVNVPKDFNFNKLKELILQTIKNSYSNISLVNEEIEIIANFKISRDTNSDIITWTRKIIKDTYASHKDDVKFIYGIEYNETEEHQISLFISNDIQNVESVIVNNENHSAIDESIQETRHITKKIFSLFDNEDDEADDKNNEDDIITKMLKSDKHE